MVEVRLEGTHKLTIQIPSCVKLRPLAVEGYQHERLRAIAPERPLPMLLHPVLNLTCHAFLTPEFQIDSKYACIESGILVVKEIAVSVHGERRAGNGGWRVRDGGWGVGDRGWGVGDGGWGVVVGGIPHHIHMYCLETVSTTCEYLPVFKQCLGLCREHITI